jgi:hypothetical protein
MALSKQVELPTGHIVSYHHVSSYVFNKQQNVVEVTVASFKDSAARFGNKAPGNSLWLAIPMNDLDLGSPLLPQIYTFLKSQEAFLNASDV